MCAPNTETLKHSKLKSPCLYSHWKICENTTICIVTMLTANLQKIPKAFCHCILSVKLIPPGTSLRMFPMYSRVN